MSSIGNRFPPELRRHTIIRELTAGKVLYLWTNFTDPPKEKYLLIACPHERPLLFVINSQISAFIQRRPDLLRCQVSLSAANYEFLRHDSYINCSQVVDDFSLDDIVGQVMADFNRLKVDLNESDKLAVHSAVSAARTISLEDKLQILPALSPPAEP